MKKLALAFLMIAFVVGSSYGEVKKPVCTCGKYPIKEYSATEREVAEEVFGVVAWCYEQDFLSDGQMDLFDRAAATPGIILTSEECSCKGIPSHIADRLWWLHADFRNYVKSLLLECIANQKKQEEKKWQVGR